MYPPPQQPGGPAVPPGAAPPPGYPAPGHPGAPPPGYPGPTWPPAPTGPAAAGTPIGHLSPHPVGGARPTAAPAPGRARRFWSGAGTALAVAATFFVGIVGLSFDSARHGQELSGGQLGLSILWLVLAACVSAAVIWRIRHPVAVCLGTAAAGVLTPVGALAPLLALPFVLAREDRRPVLLGSIAATAAAVAASFWRDGARPGDSVIFSFTPATGGETTYLPPAGYVVIGVLLVALSVGAGLVRRYAGRAHVAQQTAAVETRRAETLRTHAEDLRSQTDHLRTELSRQDERELIAREMHDTVAHNLSVMSLQASALEVTTEDPEVADAARTMRSSAHRALEEMRSLITSLRDGAEQYTGSAPALGDLATLLDEARSSGVDLAATVFVTDADSAPPALTRAVYRVVQEALTNVMKHAPGARADVDVRARPGDGVDLTVRNALTADTLGVPGSGTGIVGMRERCEALAGTFSAGVDDGRFVVRAHLPWDRPRD
ncbi:histidine kinase [Cellulosimicrobium sp. MI9406]|uniref:sensor histidine kinase n=1 Tax=Cellulosimicrobium sp. MI9406 TaxID=2931398 RepID=UPI0033AB4655